MNNGSVFSGLSDYKKGNLQIWGQKTSTMDNACFQKTSLQEANSWWKRAYIHTPQTAVTDERRKLYNCSLIETEDAICCHPQNSRVTTTELMYIEFSDNIGCIGEGEQNSFNNTAA